MSVGQIKEILFGHFRSHVYCPIDKKIDQNVGLDEISMSSNMGHLGS